MKMQLSMQLSMRLTTAFIAIIPACLGSFAVLNDVSDYGGTLSKVLLPIACMQNTFHNPAQTWRALCSLRPLDAIFRVVIAVELVVGLLGIVGVYRILRAIRGSSEDFSTSCTTTALACRIGIIVWGLGFFVILGDWFLAWQGPMKGFQTDGLGYSLMMLICLICVNSTERGKPI